MVKFKKIELHQVFSMFIKNKNKFKNIEAQIAKNIKNTEPRPKCPGSYKKKECIHSSFITLLRRRSIFHYLVCFWKWFFKMLNKSRHIDILLNKINTIRDKSKYIRTIWILTTPARRQLSPSNATTSRFLWLQLLTSNPREFPI